MARTRNPFSKSVARPAQRKDMLSPDGLYILARIMAEHVMHAHLERAVASDQVSRVDDLIHEHLVGEWVDYACGDDCSESCKLCAEARASMADAVSFRDGFFVMLTDTHAQMLKAGLSVTRRLRDIRVITWRAVDKGIAKMAIAAVKH
jgi:hypothetical protein